MPTCLLGVILASWSSCPLHAVADHRVQHLDVDVGQVPEPDAVLGDARLADRGAVRAGQVGLVVEAEHVDRDPAPGGAQADPGELP